VLISGKLSGFNSSHPDRVKQNAVVNQVIAAAFLFVVEKVAENSYFTFNFAFSIIIHTLCVQHR